MQQRDARWTLLIDVIGLVLACIGLVFAYLQIAPPSQADNDDNVVSTKHNDDLTFEEIAGTADARNTAIAESALELTQAVVGTATIEARLTARVITTATAQQFATERATFSVPATLTIAALNTQIAEQQATIDAAPSATATETRPASSTPRPSSTSTARPTEIANVSVTRNDDWTPYRQNIGGVEMAYVPAGCFEMGSEESNAHASPVHTVCFTQPFWIDVYEVTNSQFGFNGCAETSSSLNQPRNCVTWVEANAYCASRGGALPTEAQWEYAARGPDNLNYPWGNQWNGYYANHGGTAPDTIAIVGTFAAGGSWVSAMDLTGNLWEWTSSAYSQYPYNPLDGRESDSADLRRVARGGSWLYEDTTLMQAAFRLPLLPDSSNVDLGFRCAIEATD